MCIKLDNYQEAGRSFLGRPWLIRGCCADDDDDMLVVSNDRNM